MYRVTRVTAVVLCGVISIDSIDMHKKYGRVTKLTCPGDSGSHAGRDRKRCMAMGSDADGEPWGLMPARRSLVGMRLHKVPGALKLALAGEA